MSSVTSPSVSGLTPPLFDPVTGTSTGVVDFGRLNWVSRVLSMSLCVHPAAGGTVPENSMTPMVWPVASAGVGKL
jgi:hypothetical protein